MKRFILSTVSIVLAVSAIAPSAQALPKVDSAFNLQTLRLREFDARNKSEDSEKPYYPYTQAPAQTSEWTNPQTVTAEQERTADAETDFQPAALQPSETPNEASTQSLSINERRQQALDRS